MNYENYKRARNASWECLINCSIDKLPTDLSQICHHYGIRIIKNNNLTTNKLTEEERGKVVKIDNRDYIVVRDTDSIPTQRYTIAHELGHILIEQASEYEAERFAIGILAPACVLWGLKIKARRRYRNSAIFQSKPQQYGRRECRIFTNGINF